MIAVNELSTNFLLALASASVRSLVVAGAAFLALAILRVKATSIRLFTWTVVLYVALGMPVLQVLLPPLRVAIPNLFATPEQHTVISQNNLPFLNVPADHLRQGHISESTSVVAPSRSWWEELRWTSIATVAYL